MKTDNVVPVDSFYSPWIHNVRVFSQQTCLRIKPARRKKASNNKKNDALNTKANITKQPIDLHWVTLIE